MKQILIKPVITEKAIAQMESKYYTFQIDRHASKHQVKQAVSTMFDVDVYDVKVTARKGKTKRVGKMRRLATSSDLKFARVKIGKDQTIDTFSVTLEGESKQEPEKKAKETKNDNSKKKEPKKKDKKEQKNK